MRVICSYQYIPYTLDVRNYLLQEMLELHFKYSAGALWENAPKQLSLMMWYYVILLTDSRCLTLIRFEFELISLVLISRPFSLSLV